MFNCMLFGTAVSNRTVHTTWHHVDYDVRHLISDTSGSTIIWYKSYLFLGYLLLEFIVEGKHCGAWLSQQPQSWRLRPVPKFVKPFILQFIIQNLRVAVFSPLCYFWSIKKGIKFCPSPHPRDVMLSLTCPVFSSTSSKCSNISELHFVCHCSSSEGRCAQQQHLLR